ncbi:hypothetical protein H310_03811 [Aphanomyces invadans]|uniref:SEC63 domain-containing protein n=1 Tax=Aphanomyces invadans TaxID=157072 RepID=A0A024UDX1_9STRA|nr:hypothetical protein H310_03811 [Aphanomyces invadans]ETW04616.1 hypothetical protein H310_03811 [Aphanomyces invadans]|eukprot:XP_008866054.1 hypothetical protein H310_03811 [Aphanomyces invadans]
MSQNCIKFDDIVAIQYFVQSEQETTQESLLDMAASRICSHVPLRRSDKATLNELNQAKVRFRIRGETGKYLIQTDAMKANILLQCALGRIAFDDDYLALEVDTCVEMALRIIRALMDFCMESGTGALGLVAFQFWRSLALRSWENSPATTKLQLLETVDSGMAQTLNASGIHSIRQLRDMEPEQLSRVLKMPSEYCEHLISEAKAVLDFHLQVQSYLISNRIKITVTNSPSWDIHVIGTRPSSGYILVVITKGRILLLRRDITSTPTTFVVELIPGTSSISIHLLHTAQLGMDEEMKVQVAGADITVHKVSKQTFQQTTIPEAFKAGLQAKAARSLRSQLATISTKHHQKHEAAVVRPITSPSPKRAKMKQQLVPEFEQFRWRGRGNVPITDKAIQNGQNHALQIVPDDMDLRKQVHGSTSSHRQGRQHEGNNAIHHQDLPLEKPTTQAKLDAFDVHTIPMYEHETQELTLEQEFIKYIF